jgi:type II secretory ATPase GspE/PulE/Tfp pilus assembly ATPase PilB-like protein
MGIKPLAVAQLKPETKIGERLRSIIAEAIREKFREVWLKPEADGAAVFFRREALRPSEFHLTSLQHDDLTFLIFRLAKLNPLQQKRPQHGQFLVKINDRKIVMVVSAIPTIYGMRILLEMFDERVLKHSYEELIRPFPEVRQHVEDFLLYARKGIFAITGPDGSGRHLFLYTLLSRCKEIYNNIQTLETSIRYPLSGITQTEIAEDAFESALENLGNHPPDLLAVDSIRTVRAAELAFLLASRIPVLAILSSFDAYKAVDWLCSHNLKSPIKAGLLHTVVSPRMIPRICSYCAVPYDSAELMQLNVPAGMELKMNQGCEHCRNHEVLQGETFLETFRINEEALQWIMADHSSANLRRSARSAGRNTLFDLVVRDAFTDHLDMLSVAKLQAAL